MAVSETQGGTLTTTPLSGVIEIEVEKRRRELRMTLYLMSDTGKDYIQEVWSRLDSNQGPPQCECGALTNCATRPFPA